MKTPLENLIKEGWKITSHMYGNANILVRGDERILYHKPTEAIQLVYNVQRIKQPEEVLGIGAYR